ncbi:M48 family metallopeptidase [Hydrogenimonas thermophila]|uniref:M48 family metallopeptidase n=1 Tax=Hydrogenimonas thermophila TaxID=223786 RepID=UPI0029374962|nr:M48 family metallopeptidase [Hydrogenimonas thermophila]WOE71091.1 M48 family metallopeptidase [Hydrogenimonas thermophila]WOE73609.1 M48 family metallopeptidase [Hydrogenimonas thermophila]
MVEVLSIIFFLYVLIKIYISVMQIGYVSKAKDMPPVLMKPSSWIKSAKYLITNERLKILETLVEYALFIFWLSWGIRWIDTMTWNIDPVIQAAIAVNIFLIVNYIVELPFTIYQTFVIDERFKFNHSTPELFIKDQIKGGLLTLIIASILSASVAWIIINVPSWWFFSFLLIFSVIVLLNLLFPTYIAPLFNKFTPLEDEALNEKIKKLLQKSGFESEGVFVVDASKRDARLNAYFGGLGKSKRVVLFDTLLDKLSNNELLAVLGHELGHFKHNDIYKNIAMLGAILFVGFYILGHLPSQLFMELGVRETPAMIEILFMLLISVYLFIFMPVMSLVSRRNEYEADRYAVEIHGNSEDLISALKKLVDENKSFPLSHKLTIFFYHSHPPVVERLKALGDKSIMFENRDEALKGDCNI